MAPNIVIDTSLPTHLHRRVWSNVWNKVKSNVYFQAGDILNRLFIQTNLDDALVHNNAIICTRLSIFMSVE